jgi:hypothetical protein
VNPSSPSNALPTSDPPTVTTGWRGLQLPVIVVLMPMGVGWAAAMQPELMLRLLQARPDLRWPTWAWTTISRNDLVLGTMFVAQPQVPLALGNAIIGVREENSRLFPNRPVSKRQVAVPTGVPLE